MHAAATPAESFAARTKGLQKLDGYFPLYWDAAAGELWLEIPRWDEEFLFIDSLAAGTGASGDVGLDRGELGEPHVVSFHRVGPKVLLVEKNLKHRSSSASAPERAAVDGSFPTSTLWGFTVAAEDGAGRVLVNATKFLMSDLHGVARTLKDSRQGSYELDDTRSTVVVESTKAFPFNTEAEVLLTFVARNPDPDKHEPGAAISAASPTPTVVSVREHASFVKLPDAGYTPRRYDPRSGFFALSFEDYAADVSQPIDQRFIVRHRLRKKEPLAAMSEPEQPIVYYLDPGVPEPIRSALLDGARWWSSAFTAAGFKDAFRVEMLPAGADPLDVRYNDIEWVHRVTRGYSYGAAVVDPRTGEIIKGHVSLGSKRARQDYLIFEGLLAPYRNGQASDPRLTELVLARLRQLAAHEVGHTLGLAHNFAGSTRGRASVMDYPAPRVKLRADGTFDTDDAYARGLGAWDTFAIQWGYSALAPGQDERPALDAMMSAATASGLSYLSDDATWAPGSASPTAGQWDDGDDPVAQLGDTLRIRRAALDRFGEDSLRAGTPLASLEATLVPVYLFHRYQLAVATRVVGGLRYAYAVKGGTEARPEPVPPEEQRRALRAVLGAITPAELAVPERIQKLIAPQPPGYGRGRETFANFTGQTFDALGAAQTLAQLVVGELLDPQRAARLVAVSTDGKALGLAEVMDAVWQSTWKAPAVPPGMSAVKRVVEDVALATVVGLVDNARAAPEVRALAFGKLQELREWATTQEGRARTAEERAHLRYAIAQVKSLEVAPQDALTPSEPLSVPPGPPIGQGAWDDE